MPTTTSDKPVPWSVVEAQEHAFIRAQRSPDAGGRGHGGNGAATRPLQVSDLTGLAFSGGGVRSATFNLGVLQGLAKLRMLEKIDYLSTVSGGGYIGGWFQAWLYRRYYELRMKQLEDVAERRAKPAGGDAGPAKQEEREAETCQQTLEQRLGVLELAHLEQAQESLPELLLARLTKPVESRSFDDRLRKLEHAYAEDLATLEDATLPHLATAALSQIQTAIAGNSHSPRSHCSPEEAAPIKFLRDYSNYLTPRTGIFSADTWTLLVIYLRNLTFNALLLVLTGCAALLTVRGLAAAHQAAEIFLTSNTKGAWIVGLCALATGTYALHSGLSVLGKAEERQKHRRYVFFRVVVPLLLESFLVSTLLGRLADTNGVFWPYAFSLVVTVPLLGLLSWGFSRRREAILRIAAGRAGNWLPLLALVASIIAGLLGALWLKSFAELLSEGPLSVDPRFGNQQLRSLLGAPLVLCVIAGMLAAQIGITGRDTTEYVREWSSRLMAHLFLWAASCLMVGTIALYGDQIRSWVVREHLVPLASGLTLGWVVTTVSGLLAARGSERDAMPLVRSVLISITPTVFSLGALVYLAVLSGYLDRVLSAFAARSWPLVGTSAVLAGSLTLPAKASVLVASGMLAAAAALFLSWRLGVNEFSLHALYRNRLIRCYLGAVRGDERQADVFTGFDIEDDSLRIDELGSHNQTPRRQSALRPYFLVNATLNLVVGQRLAWQFRRASSFVFSPFYSGYETRSPAGAPDATSKSKLFNCGYRNTRQYGGGISLGTAMAISGAALSPNMGARTTPSMALLMTLFNVRLGWWLGNPRHAETWNKAGPDAGFVHLMTELLGRSSDSREYVYLSDGGHFENLGLYELVRRRCRHIVVSDAGEDHDSTFSDLGNAIEKCRVDFGVEIEIDVSLLQRDRTTGLSQSHYAVGRINYGCEQGTLVYLKSTLVGCEPVDVRTYAKSNPKFPHQATTDQWFDETQFESYRALGEHVVSSVAAAQLQGARSAESMFTCLQHSETRPPQPASAPEAERRRRVPREQVHG